MGRNPIHVYGRLKPVRSRDRPDATDYNCNRTADGSQEDITLIRKASADLINHKADSHTFRFKKIFDQDIAQVTVFDTVAKPVVDSVLEGYNGTIFAYGQTGSGKTYSITGASGKHEDRGIIPRTVEYAFDRIKQPKSGRTYKISVSYLEIYNESGYDLLSPDHRISKLEDLQRVVLLEDDTGLTHLRNLVIHKVSSREQVLDLLFQGDVNRVIAETPMNPHSSRSHCVFTIYLEMRKPNSSLVRHAKLNLVDLAGSERVHKTGIDGKILMQAKHINLSLHYLEQVIVALSDHDRKHIPYRNCMMTTVLKDTLGGNCLTTMIATMSLEKKAIEETVATCRFAQRVALINNQAVINEAMDPIREIAILRKEVARLKKKLKIFNTVQGKVKKERLSQDEVAECKRLVDEFSREEDGVIATGLPDIPQDMRIVKQCFLLFKEALIEARRDAQSASDARLGKHLDACTKHARHSDREISILSKQIKGLKDTMSTTSEKITDYCAVALRLNIDSTSETNFTDTGREMAIPHTTSQLLYCTDELRLNIDSTSETNFTDTGRDMAIPHTTSQLLYSADELQLNIDSTSQTSFTGTGSEMATPHSASQLLYCTDELQLNIDSTSQTSFNGTGSEMATPHTTSQRLYCTDELQLNIDSTSQTSFTGTGSEMATPHSASQLLYCTDELRLNIDSTSETNFTDTGSEMATPHSASQLLYCTDELRLNIDSTSQTSFTGTGSEMATPHTTSQRLYSADELRLNIDSTSETNFNGTGSEMGTPHTASQRSYCADELRLNIDSPPQTSFTGTGSEMGTPHTTSQLSCCADGDPPSTAQTIYKNYSSEDREAFARFVSEQHSARATMMTLKSKLTCKSQALKELASRAERSQEKTCNLGKILESRRATSSGRDDSKIEAGVLDRMSHEEKVRKDLAIHLRQVKNEIVNLREAIENEKMHLVLRFEQWRLTAAEGDCSREVVACPVRVETRSPQQLIRNTYQDGRSVTSCAAEHVPGDHGDVGIERFEASLSPTPKCDGRGKGTRFDELKFGMGDVHSKTPYLYKKHGMNDSNRVLIPDEGSVKKTSISRQNSARFNAKMDRQDYTIGADALAKLRELTHGMEDIGRLENKNTRSLEIPVEERASMFSLEKTRSDYPSGTSFEIITERSDGESSDRRDVTSLHEYHDGHKLNESICNQYLGLKQKAETEESNNIEIDDGILTGDPEVDEEVVNFYRARNKLLFS